MNNEKKELITVKEAAIRIGCGVASIYNSRWGQAAIVKTTYPMLVDWKKIKDVRVRQVKSSHQKISPLKISPYFLRRGIIDSESTSTSSFEAGGFFQQ
ncbi:MAG: hypothetical protein HF962_00560 [Sulfurovum sp.]|nr:hypothetical protein [Sulfurovum sp.]